jgi:predicted GNAT superfamily acetyltransferase
MPHGIPLAAVPAVAGPVAGSESLPDAPLVSVPIPADFHALMSRDLASARTWRMSARRAFLHYLPLGYRVTAFVADGKHDAAYYLSRPVK